MFDKPRKLITTLLTTKRVARPVITVTPSGTVVKPWEIQRSIAFYWQQFLKDQPVAFTDIVERCRYYATNSSFLKMFLPLRTSIYNHGFRLRAEKREDQVKIDEWMKQEAKAPLDSIIDAATGEELDLESNMTNREQLCKFVHDFWNEWLLLDNAVVMWMDDRPQPILLDPKRCLYSDVLGVEVMRYAHGLGLHQIEQLPASQQERFRKWQVVFINPKYGEHYRVLKRAYVGDGFAMPSLLSMFKTFGQIESMEQGLHTLAWAMRTVKRHHKLGHEIKQGNHAGKSTHFWNTVRDAGVQKAWSDTSGLSDYTSNFDHDVSFPWPDMKVFDDTCWKGVNERLKTWAGPVGQMLVAKGVTPFLTNLLRDQVVYDRSQVVGPFLETIIAKSFKPPVPFKVVWDERIFTDDRLYAEMLKFTHLQGATSPQTLVESVSLDPEEEAERKVKAAEDPKAGKKYVPVWDPAHGTAPAIDGTEKPNQKALAAKGKASDARPGSPPGQPHTS